MKKIAIITGIIVLLSVVSIAGANGIFIRFAGSDTVYKAYQTAEQFFKDGGARDFSNVNVIGEQMLGAMPVAAVDVIGTKTGTSTAGVGFYTANTATTTYPTWIGDSIDVAIYTLRIKSASSSANLRFSILASNDTGCNTSSSTTGVLNPILKQDINWFDAAPFLDGHAEQSMTVGTSTLVWDTSSLTGSGRTLVLSNLNVQCLALQVNGSSTVVWSQLKTKQY